MRLNKINSFLSTLNIALCFVGYQLATSLFLPVSSDIEGISRTVTVPYRAFALLICMLVIILNFRSINGKIPLALKVLWIYWIALIIRIFYDTNFRFDLNLNGISHLWLFIMGVILPTMFAVMKSYQMIDLNKALKWVYFGTALSMILSLFNNPELLLDAHEITGRSEGNLALNTISFGHLGTTGAALSFFLLSRGERSFIQKVIIIAILLLSFFVMIRAGSRSPILALAIVLIFWIFSSRKYVLASIFILIVTLILLIIFLEPILSLIGEISPLMELRLRYAIFEGDSSGRDILYKEAFQLFLNKPFFGSQFALFGNYGELGFAYPHNIVIEAFMALGVFGGLAMIFILWNSLKSSYILIKNNIQYYWICLILIQQIVLAMLGQFYYNQILNILLVIVLLKNNQAYK